MLPQTGRIVQPLQWYYEQSPVTPVWTDNILIYRVKLPLISPEQWHFVTITTWLVPFDTWQSTLALPQHVLRETRSGGLDVSPRCHGRHPRVCRRGLITQATTYSCQTYLLAANPTYHPSCVIMVQRCIPIDTIHPHQNNGFVLATNGTTLIKRRAGQAESYLGSWCLQTAVDVPLQFARQGLDNKNNVHERNK